MDEMTEFVAKIPTKSLTILVGVLKGQVPTKRQASLVLLNFGSYGAGILFPNDEITTMSLSDDDNITMTREEAIAVCEQLIARREGMVASSPISAAILLRLIKFAVPLLVNIIIGFEKKD